VLEASVPINVGGVYWKFYRTLFLQLLLSAMFSVSDARFLCHFINHSVSHDRALYRAIA